MYGGQGCHPSGKQHDQAVAWSALEHEEPGPVRARDLVAAPLLTKPVTFAIGVDDRLDNMSHELVLNDNATQGLALILFIAH